MERISTSDSLPQELQMVADSGLEIHSEGPNAVVSNSNFVATVQ